MPHPPPTGTNPGEQTRNRAPPPSAPSQTPCHRSEGSSAPAVPAVRGDRARCFQIPRGSGAAPRRAHPSFAVPRRRRRVRSSASSSSAQRPPAEDASFSSAASRRSGRGHAPSPIPQTAPNPETASLASSDPSRLSSCPSHGTPDNAPRRISGAAWGAPPLRPPTRKTTAQGQWQRRFFAWCVN